MLWNIRVLHLSNSLPPSPFFLSIWTFWQESDVASIFCLLCRGLLYKAVTIQCHGFHGDVSIRWVLCWKFSIFSTVCDCCVKQPPDAHFAKWVWLPWRCFSVLSVVMTASCIWGYITPSLINEPLFFVVVLCYGACTYSVYILYLLQCDVLFLCPVIIRCDGYLYHIKVCRWHFVPHNSLWLVFYTTDMVVCCWYFVPLTWLCAVGNLYHLVA